MERSSGFFDHHRLDAFHVARDALRLGDIIARRLPRGYATLSDQLRRSMLSVYLNIAEASSREGQDRLARFRCARGEAAEAAAAIEAVEALSLAPRAQTRAALILCNRLCAMLTRLSGITTRPAPRPKSTSPAPPSTDTDTDTNTRPGHVHGHEDTSTNTNTSDDAASPATSRATRSEPPD